MGHIKINRRSLAFKLSVSIGDNTNVMQTVGRNCCEVPINSTLGRACNYCVLTYFTSKGRKIVCNSNLATLEKKIARFREHFNTRLAYYYFAKYRNLSGTNF